MSTHVSIHCIKYIRASAGGTTGAPLTIDISGDGPIPHSITLFTDDQTLSERLVEAINKTFREREDERRIVDTRVAAESALYDGLDRPIEEEVIF